MARTYLVSDTAANDSDKQLSPPSNNVWLLSLRIEYTATASAGSRTLEVRFRDSSGDVIWATEIQTDFVASDVMVVNMSPGAPTVTPVDNGDEGSQHLAAVCFEANWDVQVIDTAAIAAAADDMVLHSIWADD
jgi:hypothetical protein